MSKTLLLCIALALAACAGVTPVAYTPQPQRISDPAGEVKKLILANTVDGCVSEPDFNDNLLVVKFVCAASGRGGVGNAVARLDQIQTISLEQSGEWYRVLVHHRGGAQDFSWTSKSLDDMQRMVDAFTALAKARAKSLTRAPGLPFTPAGVAGSTTRT
jgi:hypothetical protein